MRGLAILLLLLTIVVGFWWLVYLTGFVEVVLVVGVSALALAVALDRIRGRPIPGNSPARGTGPPS